MLFAPVRQLVVPVAIAFALTACAPPRPTGPSAPSGESRPEAPQRPITIVTRDEPSMLSDRLDRNGMGYPVTVSLTYRDDRDAVQPMLAERVPSQDDGTWTVNADGTMRTVYTLKPGLKWQDGQPLTAADFRFTHAVYLDREVPVTTRVPETSMREVVARDDRTVEINWREPYIWANALSGSDLTPIPRHLLADLYASDRAAFANSNFWTSEEFVGSGPYRVTRWDKGVVLSMAANPYFALGKPKIDVIEYRFVTDANTTVANFLAGTVDFAQYTAINVEQAVILRDRWVAEGMGQVYGQSLWGLRYMEFQHRDVPSHQKAVTDVRVRRALVHAIDRDALADILQQGFAPAADVSFPRDHALYQRIEQAAARYPFDLRRVEALLNEAGWIRGPDGMLRNAAGQLLDMEARVTSERQQEQAVIADNWKRAGINSSLAVVPRGLTNDPEYRISFPAVDISSHSYNRDFVGAVNVTTEAAPTSQNRFTGKNRGTYFNPDIDRLHELYLRTLHEDQRTQVVLDLERAFTTDVAQGLLYYIPQVAAVRTGIAGIRPPIRGSYLWNLWEWSLL